MADLELTVQESVTGGECNDIDGTCLCNECDKGWGNAPSANIACDTFSKQCSHYVHTIHIRDVYTYN